MKNVCGKVIFRMRSPRSGYGYSYLISRGKYYWKQTMNGKVMDVLQIHDNRRYASWEDYNNNSLARNEYIQVI